MPAHTPLSREKKKKLKTLGSMVGAYTLPEFVAFCFLELGPAILDGAGMTLWPLIFGLVWAVCWTALLTLLHRRAGRIVFGVSYYILTIYALVETGYYLLFGEMLWLSDFRYASEGSDYLGVLLEYPWTWWLGAAAMIAVGVLILRKFPEFSRKKREKYIASGALAAGILTLFVLPYAVFLGDRHIRFSGSDFGRSQASQAAYEDMFNAYRLYRICGLSQTGAKDLLENQMFPRMPWYTNGREHTWQTIDEYFESRPDHMANAMTGKLAGKNVILVLMESMDDWAVGENTPTICRLMEQGVNFTNFYTPGYGGVRTFNSEFCMNTGSFLSGAGGYAFDYVTNDFSQSLAHRLTDAGYSALEFHYNSPDFYSRGVFAPALGYERYVSFEDYVEDEDDLFSDTTVFDNAALADLFFRKTDLRFNFYVTRSAHLSYTYNEVLSDWGLRQYPEYKGLTGNEETDCMMLKARLVDDFFARLLEELEQRGELENTVIVGVTDHYSYGIQDHELLLEVSGVDDDLLLEKTPCFIWSTGLEHQEVDKTLNTSDLLPTLLNLLGVDSAYNYLGRDAFDSSYPGYAVFPDGSWVNRGVAYNVSNGRVMILSDDAPAMNRQRRKTMNEIAATFIKINNLILEGDYYLSRDE